MSSNPDKLRTSRYPNSYEDLILCTIEVSKNMATAIRSIYLIRHQIHLNTKTNAVQMTCSIYLSFIGTIFNAYQKILLNRQLITWQKCFLRTKYDRARDFLIHVKLLQVELLLSKLISVINQQKRFHKFHGFLTPK